ncbi:hypothetical protein [Pengzhenrongella frigida]|uniref:Uncharacterized protein n=1 Tax=Pengzhenrongella frigida TaxID=1259133 RepID=A0A4Q5N2E3_9MICO|nr:hypothetical protein [Cellulomonas sp. HLT2-17]RYV52226.1 hypothetical protein EUA98_04455 [Cellulomonas sp. HLT2-17]
MSSIQRVAVSTQVAVVGFVAGVFNRLGDREKGQSSAEYAGIIIVAVTLVGLLIAAATTWGGSITTLISNKIAELG